MNINDIYKTIDTLFEENKASEAENYMNAVLSQALEEQDQNIMLSILNELIGYYRQASKKEQLLEVISKSIALAKEMKIENTIPYATTLLNAATGYRSIGLYEEAAYCYEQTEAIYRAQLPECDMRYAGLYNNQSLLQQELGDFKTALTYQKKALEIALSNEEGFEIAVSYTNLANTCVALKEYEKAKEFADKAVSIFKERKIYDPHYSSAVGVLGLCSLENGQREEAKSYFLHGMDVIKRSIGKNAQYERMEEYYKMCFESDEETGKTESASGLAICRKYFEAYGRPMLETQFPDYIDQIAAGLVGEGSDCFGFDDEFSRDHDWGPGFCMWLTQETYDAIGERLAECYSRLPSEFMGYTRRESPQGQGRLGVMTIGSFYKRLLGAELHSCEDVNQIDFSQVEDWALAAATNGEVFADAQGIFTGIRQELAKGFPARIQYLKLAQSMTLFSQCGQYNYERMWSRGDYLTADRMLINAIYHAMEICHYISNVYPPHEKWLYSSTLRLPWGAEISENLQTLHSLVGRREEEAKDRALGILEAIGDYFARILYRQNIISDINPYLASHQEELVFKSNYIDADFDDLVDTIVKLEFKAFDLVQNEGGRASCQNNWPTFRIMRKSQYLTWNREMLVQYLYDFNREFSIGHNLITEKYGRMMESTAPEQYAGIKKHFPPLSEQKKAVIEQIVSIQMSMMEEFAEEYPKLADNARSLHTYEDNFMDTSYETYLRGEISTYSDKMLQLYGGYVVAKASGNENIARLTIENTARLYGFDNLEELSKNL